ncbi:hypothetical protein WICPIJ_003731 [Wickerhamomyces pijperi]|uniref:Diphthine--ammonia ligase n=1 Tax=Wickerhamomyces pijperi TaxID=599730 RepID=A0A9P8Q910_WICPI|nr:hypothetical protein WICPIJ_003731 [Wickerhamomyces pijperi]
MKFVALISGGKDSIFNILHCLSNGHELAALANLRPSNKTTQELDSFMFQTIGHDILDYYDQLIPDIPLYRGDIIGKSANQSMDYKPTAEDEIEDLYQLLAQIKQRHPDIEGVSVGAILSSYQRTRVENVCSRLGLTSLAYLWQRDQKELMTEMVGSEMEAIFIKVAAVGLNQRHLGLTLKQGYSELLSLNEKFDLHICGEGGEFETLVIDAPFFKKKLEVVDKVIDVGNDGVCYMYPKVEVVEKETWLELGDKSVGWVECLGRENAGASLLDGPFQEIYETLAESVTEQEQDITSGTIQVTPTTVKQIGNKLYISNLQSETISGSIEEQTKSVFAQLSAHLQSNNLDFSAIQHSTLLLSSMANFATVNSIYATHFTAPIPPSRVCVETSNLPSGKLLQLSVIVILNSSKFKTGLHVQGRSYWAPSNIGPYSQTVMSQLDHVSSLSGQIPLIPSSMLLSQESIKFNSVLSLQHLHNVKVLTGCINQLQTTAFVKSSSSVQTVINTWEEYCDSSETQGQNYKDSLLVVQVSELPRAADVEWGGFSYKEMVDMYADDSDEDQESKETDLSLALHALTLGNGSSIHKANEGTFFVTLWLTEKEFQSFSFSGDCHYTVYTSCSEFKLQHDASSVDFIPVANVWNYQGRNVEFGVLVTGTLM